MSKRWKYKAQGDADKVERLAGLLCMPKENPTEKDKRCYRIVANLLVQRGIDTFEKAKDFFRPDLNKLHNPFLMENMEHAVERIMVAVYAKEKIMVYGDYDVDGTSAVALVYSYLSTFYDNLTYYVPDRYEEGYGVSFKGVDTAENDGVSLIICLDCGIKATEEIAYAGEKGIDFIVCDHHLPGKELPKAYAILDPKLEGCKYPYDELSGCGIGFKLIQALQQKRGKPADDLKQYLDLVAISIAADVVPLTGENRILAFHGLRVLNTKPRVGLEAILACANIIHEDAALPYYFNKVLTIQDLSFLIGPRINAAGRMDSASKAVALLKTKNKEKAERIAEEINESNEDRKIKDQVATKEAQEEISNHKLDQQKCIVLCNENWHQGVIGIVASRIAEEHYKPTIIFTKKNGILTGSARSVKNFDIYSAIEKCRHLLTHFGGHKFAAGLSLKEDNFAEFCRLFEKEVEDNMSQDGILPEIDIDMEILLGDASEKLLRILWQFEPFGPENNEPVFSSSEIYDANGARKVGRNHLKFSAIPINENILPISCIGFSLAQHFETLKSGKKIDLCYTIEENRYQGRRELQLNVKDITESKDNNY
ncbi:MAG: single-stranded-DNA-specific exonuclease RecJ [Bacteroidales bacterium]|nr:single-stranded-DNA-specific exonuclease RecJ [Bacteroidales bacterium]